MRGSQDVMGMNLAKMPNSGKIEPEEINSSRSPTHLQTPFSTGVYESEAIEIGRVYRKQVVTKEELLNKSMDAIAGVLHISSEELNKMSRKEMETFIDSLNLNFDEEEFDSSIYAGEYMVEYVSFGGGGVQGTPSGYETYAHGWRVFCVKLDNPSIRVNFYQTGSFTATIPDICPINQ